VNCVRWDGDELVGENTDGAGFVRSLADDAGFDPRGRRCLVVGAGGAARAVVLALHDAGAQEVVVVNRSLPRAREAAALAGPAGRIVEPDAAATAVARADLIVNATPIGMEGHAPEGGGLPLDPGSIRPGRIVADLVYHPLRTLLLDAADSQGAVAVSGLGMLLHQAGLAFEHWTGRAAPITAMREAMLGQMSARDDPEQGEREP
jgi:shikimate dehydrogenase